MGHPERASFFTVAMPLAATGSPNLMTCDEQPMDNGHFP